ARPRLDPAVLDRDVAGLAHRRGELDVEAVEAEQPAPFLEALGVADERPHEVELAFGAAAGGLRRRLDFGRLREADPALPEVDARPVGDAGQPERRYREALAQTVIGIAEARRDPPP